MSPVNTGRGPGLWEPAAAVRTKLSLWTPVRKQAVTHSDDVNMRGHADDHHDSDHPGGGDGDRLQLPPLLQVSLESQQDHGGLHRQEKHSLIFFVPSQV